MTTPALADTLLSGRVTDAITGQAVGGTEVQIEYSGQILGYGTADIDGFYTVPFAVPSSAPKIVTMAVAARNGEYEVNRSLFQTSAGNVVGGPINVSIYPKGVQRCKAASDRAVIVGHFLPPAGTEFPDLPESVRSSLEYTLETRLQSVELAAKLRPKFETCDAARPRTPTLAADYARKLDADAFVGGVIGVEAPSFTVTTYVSDAHDLFADPPRAISSNVNLLNPTGANISGETHAAVLAAVAAGFAKNDDCVTAITVIDAAVQLVEMEPPYLADLRRKCEARVPNAGLLGPNQ
jgi:hypothetical protein